MLLIKSLYFIILLCLIPPAYSSDCKDIFFKNQKEEEYYEYEYLSSEYVSLDRYNDIVAVYDARNGELLGWYRRNIPEGFQSDI